jgi:hypothetical protein
MEMTVTYYTSDSGDIESLRPMTKDEMVEMYRQIVDEDPTALADLYIDFHDFSQVEFLIFKDRLSSAVLMSNSARRGIDELISKFKAQRKDGSHLVPGWEGESDMALDEALGLTGDSYGISIGATIATAVAALESLLIDLSPKSEPRPQGLHRLLQAFLRRYGVLKTQAKTITEMERKVGKRRNTFAHSLTGSYWETDASVAAMFTSEAMEDTLYTVGKLAVLIEEIVLA